MEERQVTVDGTTYPLQAPFIVMATQNPIEMEGTYPLPEAQRDRFMARISMGYPSPAAELDLLASHGGVSPLESLNAVTDAETINRVVQAVMQVHTSPAVRQYIVDLVSRTRSTTALRLGASPRAALHLLRASRAQAALEGRDHVIPDDVQMLAGPVLAHRLMPSSETQLARRTTAEVVTDLLHQVPVPPAAR
jgi:MoxR-like ATPase